MLNHETFFLAIVNHVFCFTMQLCLLPQAVFTLLFCIQINVNAYDLGEPSLSSTAQVTVNVVRNSYAPEFTPPQYAQNIDFTRAINEAVETVTARDRDEDVSAILFVKRKLPIIFPIF